MGKAGDSSIYMCEIVREDKCSRKKTTQREKEPKLYTLELIYLILASSFPLLFSDVKKS